MGGCRKSKGQKWRKGKEEEGTILSVDKYKYHSLPSYYL
jgi:predicted transposase YbfD/YdcC